MTIRSDLDAFAADLDALAARSREIADRLPYEPAQPAFAPLGSALAQVLYDRTLAMHPDAQAHPESSAAFAEIRDADEVMLADSYQILSGEDLPAATLIFREGDYPAHCRALVEALVACRVENPAWDEIRDGIGRACLAFVNAQIAASASNATPIVKTILD